MEYSEGVWYTPSGNERKTFQTSLGTIFLNSGWTLKYFGLKKKKKKNTTLPQTRILDIRDGYPYILTALQKVEKPSFKISVFWENYSLITT